jgi:hypothetical protein
MSTPFTHLRGSALLLAACLVAAPVPALAGRPCEPQALRTETLDRGLALAVRTARALDDSGADVVLLARAGQDLSAHGLRWSHLGYAYRDAGARPAGAWRIVHKLNHCGSDEAAVYRQGLGEFFLDQPHRYEAAFVALSPEVQARLLPVLQDNLRLAQLHERRYSLVAYPWAITYQQSNQWAIETLALAVDGATNRRQAQGWLQARDYRPTPLQLGAFTRLGARMSRANVAFDDHPNAQRFADRIETVTADSVFDWLQRSGLGGATITVR